MKKSLNQILRTFETFATSHSQIETFRTKPITENTANDLTYPLMWIDTQSMNASFQSGQVVISANVYFLDRVERDYSNLVSVMSSNLLKCDDFLTYYNDNECEFGFSFTYTGSATAVGYQFDDICAGYMVTVSIQVPMSRNESVIPGL